MERILRLALIFERWIPRELMQAIVEEAKRQGIEAK